MPSLVGSEMCIRDSTYADVLLNSFPEEFEVIKHMHHRDRSFNLEQNKQTAIKFHIDDLSRKSSAPPISGRGVAMAAASSSDQCHHFKASGYFTRDCPTLAQRSFPTGGRRVGKATVAILRPSGVPTTRPPPTVALNVTSRRSSSSWLRTWCSGDHLNNASPTSGVLSSCKPLNQSLNPSQKHSGSHSARWVLPWLRRPRQLQPRRRLLLNQLENQQLCDSRSPTGTRGTYDEYDDMVRDERNYTSNLDLSSPSAADREVQDPSVRGLLQTCLLYTSPSPRD